MTRNRAEPRLQPSRLRLFDTRSRREATGERRQARGEVITVLKAAFRIFPRARVRSVIMTPTKITGPPRPEGSWPRMRFVRFRSPLLTILIIHHVTSVIPATHLSLLVSIQDSKPFELWGCI